MTAAATSGTAEPAPLLDLNDIAAGARAELPDDVWDFIEGGSGGELSLQANRTALDALYVTPRVLRDVSQVDTAAAFFGRPARMPVAVAPMAYQRLAHPEGEQAAGRACGEAGVPFTVPLLSSVVLEDLAASAGDLWFQLYWLRDRGLTEELIDRAEAAHCRALLLTVDVPTMGRRMRDLRNDFSLPQGVRAVHLARPERAVPQRRRGDSSALATHTRQIFDPSLCWADVEWLRQRTSLPLVVKGVLDPRDARQAMRAGADGLVVSNHGGRQLDGAVPGIAALPEVREAVGDDGTLLLDGGIRSGVDVVKALALGASGVLLGRPALHGLAVGGQKGLTHVLSLLHEELVDALSLSGCRDLSDAAGLRLTTAGAGRKV